MKCPMCEEEVLVCFEIEIDEPFVAYDPWEGLQVWGPADVQKDIVCYQGGAVVHFRFVDGEERLVQMAAAPPLDSPWRVWEKHPMIRGEFVEREERYLIDRLIEEKIKGQNTDHLDG